MLTTRGVPLLQALWLVDMLKVRNVYIRIYFKAKCQVKWSSDKKTNPRDRQNGRNSESVFIVKRDTNYIEIG